MLFNEYLWTELAVRFFGDKECVIRNEGLKNA